jgi:hypothetical protein
MSALKSVPFCFDFCDFIVYIEIREYYVSRFIFPLKIALTIVGLLILH